MTDPIRQCEEAFLNPDGPREYRVPEMSEELYEDLRREREMEMAKYDDDPDVPADPQDAFIAGMNHSLSLIKSLFTINPEGANITDGVDAAIWVGIGRGHYEDKGGDYELAKDVHESTSARAINYLSEWAERLANRFAERKRQGQSQC